MRTFCCGKHRNGRFCITCGKELPGYCNDLRGIAGIYSVLVRATGERFVGRTRDLAAALYSAPQRVGLSRANVEQYEITILERCKSGKLRGRLAHWKRALRPSRKNRKYQVLEAPDWNRTNQEIARELGVTSSRVSAIRVELGKPRAPRIGQTSFDGVDWTKRDSVIAKEVGLSRERVRQVRLALGKPKLIDRRKLTKIFWTPDRIQLLGSDTDAAVARRLGCSKSSVYTQRKKLGISGVPTVSNLWKAEILALLGKESDASVGKRFGISLKAIWRKRHKLGIRSKTEQEGSYQGWKGSDADTSSATPETS